MLLAFLSTFADGADHTRIGRLRGWGSGSVRGVHLHHLVPGIVRSLAAATAIIAFRPGAGAMLALSGLFGVGAALTLDEFALILHLDDVYWTREGRSSIEAALMALAFGGLCLLATAPLGATPRGPAALGDRRRGGDRPGVRARRVPGGEGELGAFGLFVPGLALRRRPPREADIPMGATPLLRDRSSIGAGRRAVLRDERYTHRTLRIYHLIGGVPHRDRADRPSRGGHSPQHPGVARRERPGCGQANNRERAGAAGSCGSGRQRRRRARRFHRRLPGRSAARQPDKEPSAAGRRFGDHIPVDAAREPSGERQPEPPPVARGALPRTPGSEGGPPVLR